ncbi:hypothetical protein [Sediminibacterium sp.]|uniref:hypothetical protein n=1 Tax=Sediminibacterium sp. TaxID=1917865 RepID=UPI00273427D3|nr:hypothetical protein [Sediminibacterium sp.]MDP3394433.1 hypothetical protein [Sediminibacterium sp.]MDP3568268.1 hypothetical protein [Sediminibacterium sp.]
MRTLFCIIGIFFAINTASADSLDIQLKASQIQHGESIDFECKYPPNLNKPKSILTLHLWVEDLNRLKTWKFRYPLAGGKAIGSIKIDSSMKEGAYALHFLVQQSPLSIYGTINNFIKKDSVISMILSSGKEIIMDDIKTDEHGNFRINKYIFEDSVNFIFTPKQKKKGKTDALNISLITPVDSVFKAEVSKTLVVQIGKKSIEIPKATNIVFDPFKFKNDNTIPEVVVYGHRKSKEEMFNEKYSTDLYKRDDEKIISGFENFTMIGYTTVLEYLNDRIPGLRILQTTVKPSPYLFTMNEVKTDIENNLKPYWTFAYRSSNEANLFIDEILVEPEQLISFPMSDIAIIKIIPPPFIGGWGSNPFAILIYSNRQEFKNPTNKHSFTINGYTPARWIIKN